MPSICSAQLRLQMVSGANAATVTANAVYIEAQMQAEIAADCNSCSDTYTLTVSGMETVFVKPSTSGVDGRL